MFGTGWHFSHVHIFSAENTLDSLALYVENWEKVGTYAGCFMGPQGMKLRQEEQQGLKTNVDQRF